VSILLALTLFGIPGLFDGAAPGPCPGSAERTAALVSQVQREWPLRAAADPVSVYVKALAGRLIQADGGAGSKAWRVDVARDLAPNAFAVGDGYMIVTDGLVAYAVSESQLAAVIAHEMGHVMAGHFCRQQRPPGDDYRIGSLIQHYEASAEEQADARAVVLLRGAGFDPTAMAELLHCLASDDPPFAARLESRARRLERSGMASSEPQAYRESPAFEKVRRAVIKDLRGVAPGLSHRALGQTCR